jgi:hypothetical protein
MSTTLITNNAHPPLYTTNTYTSAAITQKTGEHEMFTLSQKYGEHSLGKKNPGGHKEMFTMSHGNRRGPYKSYILCYKKELHPMELC